MRVLGFLAEQGNGGRGGFPAPAWLVIGFIVLVAVGILVRCVRKRGS